MAERRQGPGRWWVFSVTEPKWDGEGVAAHLDEDDPAMPKEVVQWIASRKTLFGAEPEDLDYGFEIPDLH